jgi:hypothetical protein
MSNRKMAVGLLGSFLAGVAFILACGSALESSPDGGPVEDCARCPSPPGGPLELAQPVRVITADTDPAQIEGGMIRWWEDVGSGREFVEGPLVITDLTAQKLSPYPPVVSAYFVPKGRACDPSTARIRVKLTEGTTIYPVHGAKLYLRAGEILCVDTGQEVTWAGYRPYH